MIPFPAQRQSRSAMQSRNNPPPADIPRRPSGNTPASGGNNNSERQGQDLNDMEIPTFIRRQMD